MSSDTVNRDPKAFPPKRANNHRADNLRGTIEYRAWSAAKGRCYNPKNREFKYYGARGITMCEAWRDDVAAFCRDMGPKPVGFTLERKNNDGNYEPGNCVWATQKDQNWNRRPTIRKTRLTPEELATIHRDYVPHKRGNSLELAARFRITQTTLYRVIQGVKR